MQISISLSSSTVREDIALNKGNDDAKQKVAIVTDSTSGIGYATSLMLARRGFYTYASVRNVSRSAGLESVANTEKLPLKVIQLDVTNDSSLKDALEKIASEKGRIDVLVNTPDMVSSEHLKIFRWMR